MITSSVQNQIKKANSTSYEISNKKALRATTTADAKNLSGNDDIYPHRVLGHTVTSPEHFDYNTTEQLLAYLAGHNLVIYDCKKARQSFVLNSDTVRTAHKEIVAETQQNPTLKKFSCVSWSSDGYLVAVGELGLEPRVLVFKCVGQKCGLVTVMNLEDATGEKLHEIVKLRFIDNDAALAIVANTKEVNSGGDQESVLLVSQWKNYRNNTIEVPLLSGKRRGHIVDLHLLENGKWFITGKGFLRIIELDGMITGVAVPEKFFDEQEIICVSSVQDKVFLFAESKKIFVVEDNVVSNWIELKLDEDYVYIGCNHDALTVTTKNGRTRIFETSSLYSVLNTVDSVQEGVIEVMKSHKDQMLMKYDDGSLRLAAFDESASKTIKIDGLPEKLFGVSPSSKDHDVLYGSDNRIVEFNNFNNSIERHISLAQNSEVSESDLRGFRLVKRCRNYLFACDRHGNILVYNYLNPSILYCKEAVHDSEILCMDLLHLKDGNMLVLTGSRDRKVLLMEFIYDHSEKKHIFNVLKKMSDHSSSVTGVKICIVKTEDAATVPELKDIVVKIVACGLDKKVIFKQIDFKDEELKIINISTSILYSAAVDMVFDPTNRYFCISSQDGRIYVFNLHSNAIDRVYEMDAEGKATVVKLNTMKRINQRTQNQTSTSNSQTKITFDPSGFYLCVSLNGRRSSKLAIIQFFSGKNELTFESGQASTITGLLWREAGKIISVSMDGIAVIHKVINTEILNTITNIKTDLVRRHLITENSDIWESDEPALNESASIAKTEEPLEKNISTKNPFAVPGNMPKWARKLLKGEQEEKEQLEKVLRVQGKWSNNITAEKIVLSHTSEWLGEMPMSPPCIRVNPRDEDRKRWRQYVFSFPKEEEEESSKADDNQIEETLETVTPEKQIEFPIVKDPVMEEFFTPMKSKNRDSLASTSTDTIRKISFKIDFLKEKIQSIISSDKENFENFMKDSRKAAVTNKNSRMMGNVTASQLVSKDECDRLEDLKDLCEDIIERSKTKPDELQKMKAILESASTRINGLLTELK